EFARAISGGYFFQERSSIRQMLAQRVCERVGAPEEHAAVPEVTARVEKPPGQAEIRLFGEAADAQRAIVIRRTGLDIAIAGLGGSRADAEHNNVFSESGNLDSSTESS